MLKAGSKWLKAGCSIGLELGTGIFIVLRFYPLALYFYTQCVSWPEPALEAHDFSSVQHNGVKSIFRRTILYFIQKIIYRGAYKQIVGAITFSNFEVELCNKIEDFIKRAVAIEMDEF